MTEIKKCDFCLVSVLERQICPICDNRDKFYFTRLCEECMSIHLDKHEKNLDTIDVIPTLELSKANKTGMF